MARAWIEVDLDITISDETLDAMDTYSNSELGAFFEGFAPWESDYERRTV